VGFELAPERDECVKRVQSALRTMVQTWKIDRDIIIIDRMTKFLNQQVMILYAEDL
jgi:hypothetical protein